MNAKSSTNSKATPTQIYNPKPSMGWKVFAWVVCFLVLLGWGASLYFININELTASLTRSNYFLDQQAYADNFAENRKFIVEYLQQYMLRHGNPVTWGDIEHFEATRRSMLSFFYKFIVSARYESLIYLFFIFWFVNLIAKAGDKFNSSNPAYVAGLSTMLGSSAGFSYFLRNVSLVAFFSVGFAGYGFIHYSLYVGIEVLWLGLATLASYNLSILRLKAATLNPVEK